MGLLNDWASTNGDDADAQGDVLADLLSRGAKSGVGAHLGSPPGLAGVPMHDQVLAADSRRTGPQAPGPNTQWPSERLLHDQHRRYLDRYYDPVLGLAREHGVDPALVLGMGGESGFASAGTYRRTNDAFGMTGGSTGHMTRARSPEENVKQFFDSYGDQIRGAGTDVHRFLNGLEGLDAAGRPVPGWKRYNSADPKWMDRRRGEIATIQRELPIYTSLRPK